MQTDPTRTKILRNQYARQLTQVFIRLYTSILPQLLRLLTRYGIQLSTRRLTAISDISIIIDYEINKTATDRYHIIEHNIIQGFKRGKTRAAQEIKHTGRTITPDLTDLDYEALELLRENNFQLVKDVSMDVRKEMLRITSEGILQGKGARVIGTEISKSLSMPRKRCTMIARTEIIRAYNTAKQKTYTHSGVTYYEWSTAFDDRTCDECAGLDGKLFRVGGGDPVPPIHPNCRCTTLPSEKE